MADSHRSCPCKKLPLCLSSFTAAEYGDIHSLTKTGANVVDRKDVAGYTPLHLASQNGHVAVTALLLRMGARVDESTCGATSLHRSSFSGAVSTMKLLIDAKSNLMAHDTSFGDETTPLHKAAAGGRFLAVQLLLESLRQQDLLEKALETKDATNRTPLDVALRMQENQEIERSSVRRWDVVAGGSADWDKCVGLLESVAEKQKKKNASSSFLFGGRLQQLRGPRHLATLASCLQCEAGADGQCPTASWEADLRCVLASSITYTVPEKPTDAISCTMEKSTQLPQDGVVVETKPATPSTEKKKSSTNSLGRNCQSCGVRSFALFQNPLGAGLVCRQCRRNSHR